MHNQQRFEINQQIWQALPTHFDTINPLSIVKHARRVEGLKLTPLNTFLLLDLHKEACDANTVVFDTQRGILSTTKTSRQLLKRSWQSSMDFAVDLQNRHIATELGHTRHRLPIVFKDIQYIPLGARSRENTSWVGAHQLTDYYPDGKVCELLFGNNITVTIKRSATSFEKQLATANAIKQERRACEQRQSQLTFVGDSAEAATANLHHHDYQREVFVELLIFGLKQNGYEVNRGDVHEVVTDFFGNSSIFC